MDMYQTPYKQIYYNIYSICLIEDASYNLPQLGYVSR